MQVLLSGSLWHSLATNHNGNLVSQARYTPYGQVRWSGETVMPTKYAFTGQRSDRFGLMDYHARYYSSRLGRFISADSLVPSLFDPAYYDRYSYVRNNPVRRVDISGHLDCDAPHVAPGDCTPSIPPITLQVNLFSGLPQNVKGIQEGIYVNGTMHPNLCGQLALSMIYETITGKPISIQEIAKKDNFGPKYLTNGYDLSHLFTTSMLIGSKADYYYGKTRMTILPNGKVTQVDKLSNESDWVTSSSVMTFLTHQLQNNRYVVLGVYLDKQGVMGSIVGSDTDGAGKSVVGHWVIVTEVGANYIMVNDPWCNCSRTVDSKIIETAFKNFAVVVVITPPPSPRDPSTAY